MGKNINVQNFIDLFQGNKLDSFAFFVKEKKKLLVVLSIPLVIISLIILFFISQPSGQIATPKVTPTIQSQNPNANTKPTGIPDASAFIDKKIVAKVGEESIYSNSVENLVLDQPRVKGVDYYKKYIDRLVEESIILQSAQNDKIITLNPSFFNSENIDLDKRAVMVKQVKDAVGKKADRLEGSVISVWFYNTAVGSLGYERGKKFASEKISPLHSQVKEGALTIQKAGELLKKDTSLSQVDKNYFYNTIYDFSAQKGEKISFDDSFDQALWSLDQGETTDLLLLKDKNLDNGQLIDAVYTFGRISNKAVSNDVGGFSAWLEKNRKSYEIQYF